MTGVASRVIALCEQQSGKEAYLDSDLVRDLELDSLDRIELAMVIEDHFGIEIPDDEVDDVSLGIVAGLVDYVERKLL